MSGTAYALDVTALRAFMLREIFAYLPLCFSTCRHSWGRILACLALQNLASKTYSPKDIW